MAALVLRRSRCFGSTITKYRWPGGTFSVFLPERRDVGPKKALADVPVLLWLPPVGQDDESLFLASGGVLARRELVIVSVGFDSARGPGVGYDPAAFEDLRTRLPEAVLAQANVDLKHCGIAGAIEGGYAALTASLRDPSCYSSVSAFSPICHPAATGDLASSLAVDYDPVQLAQRRGSLHNILIDQGLTDPRYNAGRLGTEAFRDACRSLPTSVPSTIRLRQGYDDRPYFVMTFIHEHLAHHIGAFERLRRTK